MKTRERVGANRGRAARRLFACARLAVGVAISPASESNPINPRVIRLDFLVDPDGKGDGADGPRVPVKPEEAKPYDYAPAKLRHPRETKGMGYNATTEAAKCCDGGTCC